MKIDLIPTIEQADERDRICIDMREIEALYVVRLANGEDFTTKFDKKELDEFQRSKTVTEMMNEWEENIIRRIAIIDEALKTNLHPTFTFERNIMVDYGGDFPVWTGKTERLRCELTKEGRLSFMKDKAKLSKQLGKMSFIKIC